MGMRFRLKQSYPIAGFPRQARIVLQALKEYGMIVADNGSNWFVSGAPHPKWSNDQLHTLHRVPGFRLRSRRRDEAQELTRRAPTKDDDLLASEGNADDPARLRRVDEPALADEQADVAEPGEEDQVPRLQCPARDLAPIAVLGGCVVRQVDAELAVHVHHEAGAVEAAGTRAAPGVRDADVAAGEPGCALPHRDPRARPLRRVRLAKLRSPLRAAQLGAARLGGRRVGVTTEGDVGAGPLRVDGVGCRSLTDGADKRGERGSAEDA